MKANNKKKVSFNGGFSFVEVMIAVIIITITIALASYFMIEIMRFYKTVQAKGEVQRDARAVLDLINRNMRQAYSSSVVITRFNSAQPPCSMVTFQYIDGSNMRFYQLNSKLYMGRSYTAGVWNDTLAGNNLITLFFAYPRTDDGTDFSVSVCFQKGTYQGGAPESVQQSAIIIRIMN